LASAALHPLAAAAGPQEAAAHHQEEVVYRDIILITNHTESLANIISSDFSRIR
jgi:hypothetical protein